MVLVLTHTMPLTGGACAGLLAEGSEAEADLAAGAAEAAAGAGDRLEDASAAGLLSVAFVEAGAAAPTVTRELIFEIVLFETPAFARPSTEE